MTQLSCLSLFLHYTFTENNYKSVSNFLSKDFRKINIEDIHYAPANMEQILESLNISKDDIPVLFSNNQPLLLDLYTLCSISKIDIKHFFRFVGTTSQIPLSIREYHFTRNDALEIIRLYNYFNQFKNYESIISSTNVNSFYDLLERNKLMNTIFPDKDNCNALLFYVSHKKISILGEIPEMYRVPELLFLPSELIETKYVEFHNYYSTIYPLCERGLITEDQFEQELLIHANSYVEEHLNKKDDGKKIA